MSDKDLKEQGTVDPRKKPTWLKEVRVDAARNTVEHLRRQKEAQEFEQAKARGITPEEIISKGREDLDMPEPENVSEDQPKANSEADADEVARLKAELKAARTQNTRLENKLKAQDENPVADEEEDTPGSGKKEEVK